MDSLEKKYYKISEVAELLGLPASTLRFWEKSFTVIKPKRNNHGTRFYTAADIEKISMIHYLVKERGLKLEAAQEQIRSRHRTASPHSGPAQRDALTRAEPARRPALSSLTLRFISTPTHIARIHAPRYISTHCLIQ